jgi:hypothetical protein
LVEEVVRPVVMVAVDVELVVVVPNVLVACVVEEAPCVILVVVVRFTEVDWVVQVPPSQYTVEVLLGLHSK